MKTIIRNIIVAFLFVMGAFFVKCLPGFAEDGGCSFKTATASTNHASHPPANAIDGIITTRWQHLSSDLVPSITFDFGTSTSFNKLVVLPRSAAAVKEFIIEAADDADMTINRIILISGTELEDENVFSFESVSRRYVKYTVTKKDGIVGLLEFSAFKNEPYKLELSEIPDAITIPSIGGADNIVKLPPVLVKDTSNHLVHSSNYALKYYMEDTLGVTLSQDGTITVTDKAQEKEISVRVSVASNSDIYIDITLKLILYQNDIKCNFKTATASTNHTSYPPEYAIDGITTTRWQHLSFDLMPSITFDFGKSTSFNKLVVLPTAAAAVKEFMIEAADDADMTKNRIILVSGTALKDENVFSFKSVSRRYVKYTVTKKDGTVGLLEFSAFENNPYKLELSELPDTITIPSIGGTDNIVKLPPVLVKDTSNHLVHSSNYALEYYLEDTLGVTLSQEGIITVTSEAQEKEISVRISVVSNSGVYIDIPLRLIAKENLLYQKDIMGSEELNVLNDGRLDTYFEPGEELFEAVFDLGEPTELNKFILISENYEYSENVRISGALSEDFSDELQLADVGVLQSEDMVIATERNTVRYIKLSMFAKSGIRICEFEAYSVYPDRLVLETNFTQAYIPGFEDDGAVTVPGVEAKIVDIYGDKVHDEFSQIIWSATRDLPQGVTLNQATGELTVEPIASSTEIELLASCVQIESINKILTVELLDKISVDDGGGNLAYYKTVKSSPSHNNFPAENAVDGLEGSRLQFISSVKNPYLIVDLGEELEFNSTTTKFLDASKVVKATIRAAKTEEELFNEENIIAQIDTPSNNEVVVNLPITEMRYVMIYFDEIAGTVAITEFEIRRIIPAIIYAPKLPRIIKIPSEGEIVTPDAEIEIRDKSGSVLVFTESDYVISSANIPEGVTLNTVTASLTVTSASPETAFDICITSTEDETVYNIFTVVLTKNGEEYDEQSEIILEQAVNKFNISDYVSSAVANSDFILPLKTYNDVTISYSESSGAIEIDSSGKVKVNRGLKDAYVSIEVIFELDGNSRSKTVVIKVPAKEDISSESNNAGCGKGSGGGGISAIASIVKEEEKIPEAKYSDISEVPWAEEYLSELVRLKIMNGSDGLLRPKSFITREEFVKMIVCAFIPNGEKVQISFKDIESSSWCYGYVAIAVAAEVVYGFTDDLFGAGLTITRQDAAVIAKRAADAAGIKLKKDKDVLFNDEEDIADYAKEAVWSLSGAGIINGDNNGAFLPGNSITRAEAAKIICLLIKEENDEE